MRRGFFLLLLLLAVSVEAKKKGSNDENSTPCVACRRLMMNVNESVSTAAIEMIKQGNVGLNFAHVEEYLHEYVPKGCNFASTFYDGKMFKACNNLIDEYEEELVAHVYRWLKSEANEKVTKKVEIVKEFCHNVAHVCPKSVQPEVLADTQTTNLKSERPPNHQKEGGPMYIVAAEFMDLVIKNDKDIITYIYPEVMDPVHKLFDPIFEKVANHLSRCPSIRLGRIYTKLNQIPPPYGRYMQNTHGMCIWRSTNKQNPIFIKSMQGGNLSQYDVLDFIYQSIVTPESKECMGRLAKELDMEKLQESPDETIITIH